MLKLVLIHLLIEHPWINFINDGVKIDNLVQIAHNVILEKIPLPDRGIAGSTKIGENCQIGGQVGVAGHIIGNNVKIDGGTGVYSNVDDNSILRDIPAIDINNLTDLTSF